MIVVLCVKERLVGMERGVVGGEIVMFDPSVARRAEGGSRATLSEVRGAKAVAHGEEAVRTGEGAEVAFEFAMQFRQIRLSFKAAFALDQRVCYAIVLLSFRGRSNPFALGANKVTTFALNLM